jgi:UDP-2,4-diacetamido-2,4,6-trideoxy-beta-L-altropyranose hydrolase
MRVAVRADASGKMGIGHLRRCLSLLNALSDLGAQTFIVSRSHDGVAADVMRNEDVDVRWLPAPNSDIACEDGRETQYTQWAGVPWLQDADETIDALRAFAPDWVIVDHYALDAQWHDRVRSALKCRIFAIDDLGDRELSADILLDANASPSHSIKYEGRLQRQTKLLTGLRFALFSKSYQDAASYIFCEEVRSIGIFMGGGDPLGLSSQVLRILREDVGFAGEIEIVIGSPDLVCEDLAKQSAEDHKLTLSVNLPQLSNFYARHDLQIGAGGTATYERCLLGVPAIAVIAAENQLAVIPELEAMRAIRSAILPEVKGTHLLPNAPPLDAVVRELIADPEKRRQLSIVSRSLIDAKGAERAALSILKDGMTIRRTTEADARLLHVWRNHSTTRSMSLNSGEISLAHHVEWLKAALADAQRVLLMAQIGNRPIGTIRFDLIKRDVWRVSLFLDPDLHMLGLGKHMLELGEQALKAQIESDFVIQAEVIPGNAVSANMFVRGGYNGGPIEFWKNFNVERDQ